MTAAKLVVAPHMTACAHCGELLSGGSHCWAIESEEGSPLLHLHTECVSVFSPDLLFVSLRGKPASLEWHEWGSLHGDRYRLIRARDTQRCFCCGSVIPPGSLYWRARGKNRSAWCSMYHPICFRHTTTVPAAHIQFAMRNAYQKRVVPETGWLRGKLLSRWAAQVGVKLNAYHTVPDKSRFRVDKFDVTEGEWVALRPRIEDSAWQYQKRNGNRLTVYVVRSSPSAGESNA